MSRATLAEAMRFLFADEMSKHAAWTEQASALPAREPIATMRAPSSFLIDGSESEGFAPASLSYSNVPIDLVAAKAQPSDLFVPVAPPPPPAAIAATVPWAPPKQAISAAPSTIADRVPARAKRERWRKPATIALFLVAGAIVGVIAALGLR